MKNFFLTISLVLVLIPFKAHAIDDDKIAHFSMSALGTASISLLFYGATGQEFKLASGLIGSGMMLTLGVAKELMDMGSSRNKNQELDIGDLQANVLGVASGFALFMLIAPDNKRDLIIPQVVSTRNGPAPGVLLRVSLE